MSALKTRGVEAVGVGERRTVNTGLRSKNSHNSAGRRGAKSKKPSESKRKRKTFEVVAFETCWLVVNSDGRALHTSHKVSVWFSRCRFFRYFIPHSRFKWIPTWEHLHPNKHALFSIMSDFRIGSTLCTTPRFCFLLCLLLTIIFLLSFFSFSPPRFSSSPAL